MAGGAGFVPSAAVIQHQQEAAMAQSSVPTRIKRYSFLLVNDEDYLMALPDMNVTSTTSGQTYKTSLLPKPRVFVGVA